MISKEILVSLMVIGIVGAVAGGSTLAVFSDTETSSGNTFAAGEIDLAIDTVEDGEHLWYNGNLTEFFNLSDVKPGDTHERTISLHVDSNPAWACAVITPTEDADNGLTEPESDVDSTDGAGAGELDSESDLHIWTDGIDFGPNDDRTGSTPNAGNNVFNDDSAADNDQSVIGPQRPLPDSAIVWTIADADENIYPSHSDGEALVPSNVYYLGVEYSLPFEVGNVAQTDSYMADVEFYVEQSRNNENFQCQNLLGDETGGGGG